MRSYLAAKAEEEKRKTEEEKTRQEGYRLEQRKIEQTMLRESLNSGVPPAMVPMIYAGIGGSNLNYDGRHDSLAKVLLSMFHMLNHSRWFQVNRQNNPSSLHPYRPPFLRIKARRLDRHQRLLHDPRPTLSCQG